MSLSVYERAAAALRPTGVDLTPVLDAISSIALPTQDLAPVLDAIGAIRMPEIDLSPLEQSVESLRESVDLGPILEAIEAIDIPDVDFTQIHSGLSSVQSGLADKIDALQSTMGDIKLPDIDLQPVVTAVAEVEAISRAHSASWDQFIEVLAGPTP